MTRLNRPMTYEEIGQRLGITRVAVQQIEQRALKKLRRMLEKQDIGLDDARQILERAEARHRNAQDFRRASFHVSEF